MRNAKATQELLKENKWDVLQRPKVETHKHARSEGVLIKSLAKHLSNPYI